MKYYQIIIFIVIIPITIFLLAITTDGAFKKRIKELRQEHRLKYEPEVNTKPKKIYQLNNGIGFGYGREYFQCENASPSGNNCDMRKSDIGIKFHTFKMSTQYEHKKSLDDVVLKDYCSREYLEKNFINILNNIWLGSGLTFYFKDHIIEDEIKNLVYYYNYTPKENTIFPDCGNIEDYLKNPHDLSKTNVDNSSSLDDLLREVPSFTTSAVETNGRIDDNMKKLMAQNDIEILKELLSKENVFDTIENTNTKKVIRNILFRMIDETNYLDDNDFHVCFLPFIQDDIAFILEGRSHGNNRGRPILVVSMFYKDCNKIYRVIENISSDKTCGLWLDKLLGNYRQLRSLERDYNSIAKIDLVADNSDGGECNAKKLDPSHTLNTLLDNYRSDYNDLMDDMKEHNEQYNLEELNRNILLNTRKLQDIYEYDYNNDPKLIAIRKFKNGRGPLTIVETINGQKEEREIIASYAEMRQYIIDEINARLETEKEEIETRLDNDNALLNRFKEHAQTLQVPLDNKRAQIQDLINPHLGTNNLKKLKKLKEVMERLRVEINLPLEMAKKVRMILGLNLLIVDMFRMPLSEDNNELKLKDFSDEPICKILEYNISNGGLVFTKSQRDLFQENRGNLTYKQMKNIDSISGSNIIANKYYIRAPANNSNNFHNGNGLDKCTFLGEQERDLCERSKNYETSRDNELDLNAQYYIVFHLLKRIYDGDEGFQVTQDAKKDLENFFEELKFKCGNCRNELDNYRINADYFKRDNLERKTLFTEEGAIDNYKWITKYIYDNRIDSSRFNFLRDSLEELHADSNSVYTNNLMDNDIVYGLLPTERIFGIGDANGCNDERSTNITNNVGLEELILDYQKCSKTNTYLNSFDTSFI